jgi:hypothetical protein
MNAAFTVGQDGSLSRADCSTVRPVSATAAPAEVRSLVVRRERGGIDGSDSVNDRRPHTGFRQAQRCFVHLSNGARPASGTSRGRVVTSRSERDDRIRTPDDNGRPHTL